MVSTNIVMGSNKKEKSARLAVDIVLLLYGEVRGGGGWPQPPCAYFMQEAN